MYLRKTGQQKYEISIDEPLSVDYDGNELLLSDILGSDSDVVYRKMEEDEEKKDKAADDLKAQDEALSANSEDIAAKEALLKTKKR